MISYIQGDIFNSNCEAIVNTVNTKGIMGKGLALQFKKRYPENFKAYEHACKNNDVVLGKMFIFKRNSFDAPKYIINFPTKGHWKSKSRLQDIEQGLQDLILQIRQYNISSIAIPPLGSGLGGLLWSEVKECIETALSHLSDVDIKVYEPLTTSSPAPKSITKVKLTPTTVLLLQVFREYMTHAISVNMTFLEAHKVCYFLQESGINLKLRFTPYIYGPYAPNLGHLFTELESAYIHGYSDGTVRPFDTFTVMPQNKEERQLFPLQKKSTDIVLNFIKGFEDPLGIELLSTVHWLVYHDNIEPNLNSIKCAIQSWGKEKQQAWGHRKIKFFSDKHIQIALKRVIEHSLKADN